MKPFTEPSAYRDTMSPMWRKLDLCSDMFSLNKRVSLVPVSPFIITDWYFLSSGEVILTLQRLQFSSSPHIHLHSAFSSTVQKDDWGKEAKVQKLVAILKTALCFETYSTSSCMSDRAEGALLHIHFRGWRLLLSGLWAKSAQWHVFVFIHSRPWD